MAEVHLRSFARRWRAVGEEVTAPTAVQRTRGLAYERSGRVTDLRVALGAVSARVQGSRATPYPVRVEVAPLDHDAWTRVVARLAGQVRHVAALLAGQLPEGLEAELATLGVRLVPDAAEITTACPCADPAAWCAHVMALWEATAAQLASDPFVLLQLRGRGRERLLAELADARRRGAEQAPGLSLAEVDVARWRHTEHPPQEVHLPPLREPPTPAGVLQVLGDPPGWEGGVSAAALFGPLIGRAADWAREVEAADQPEP